MRGQAQKHRTKGECKETVPDFRMEKDSLKIGEKTESERSSDSVFQVQLIFNIVIVTGVLHSG